MLGINIGSLGFLTAVPSEEMPRALDQVWEGDSSSSPAHLLEASGETAAGRCFSTALNDL